MATSWSTMRGTPGPPSSSRWCAAHGAAARTTSTEVSPGLWAGVGLVREGAGTALVGSYSEVTELIREYAGYGIEEFILSGWPHLEEAYRVGEYVLPRLDAAAISY